MDLGKLCSSIFIWVGLVSNTIYAVNTNIFGAWICAGMFAIAAAINNKNLGDQLMEEKDFKGTLKEVILQMLENDTDCCEVTNTVGDTSVTVEVTITKIVSGGEVIYDAAEADDDVELVAFGEDDIEYLS